MRDTTCCCPADTPCTRASRWSEPPWRIRATRVGRRISDGLRRIGQRIARPTTVFEAAEIPGITPDDAVRPGPRQAPRSSPPVSVRSGAVRTEDHAYVPEGFFGESGV
jgi:hypothetical protein